VIAGPAVASGVFKLPAGIQWSDVWYISQWTLIYGAIICVIGVILLRALGKRSVALMITVVVAVTVLTMLAGVFFIARRMLGTATDRDAIQLLMPIAGLAGLVVALVVGRRLTKASRALSSAVHGAGDSGVYTPPERALPAELSDLSEALATAHERLNAARARERALEASRRELVAWVSHDLRTPLAGLRAMAEALEDQVVIDPRTVSQYHTQTNGEREGK